PRRRVRSRPAAAGRAASGSIAAAVCARPRARSTTERSGLGCSLRSASGRAFPLGGRMKLRSADDIARAALRRLPPFLGEYVAGGSYAEHTLRRNVEDLSTIELRQRVLCNVAEVDTRTRLFGRDWSLPL